MRKITARDKLHNVDVLIDPKGSIDPERVFNDNTVVIDYLNAMLIAAPQPSLDFGDIRYVHPPGEISSTHGAPPSFAVDNLFNFESERARTEIKALKSENDDLKLKIARLVAQLNETECNFDTVLTENNNLKSRTAYLQDQLKISDKIAKNATRRLQTTTALITAKEAVEVKSEQVLETVEPEKIMDLSNYQEQKEDFSETVVPEIIADDVSAQMDETVLELVSQDIVDDQTAPSEEQYLAPVEPHNITGAEIINEVPPESDIFAQKEIIVNVATSVTDVDRAFLAKPFIIDENTKKKADRGLVILSQKRIALDETHHRQKTSAKILKRHQAKNFKANTEPAPAVKVIFTENGNQEIVKKKFEPKPDPVVQPLLDSETEGNHEADHIPDMKEIQFAEVDESNVGAVAAPKIFVRQHIKNYEVIQEEADGTAPKLIHDIVS